MAPQWVVPTPRWVVLTPSEYFRPPLGSSDPQWVVLAPQWAVLTAPEAVTGLLFAQALKYVFGA